MKKRLSRRMRKMLLMVASMALVLGLAIGGTVAWLIDSTDSVVNTFTESDVNITLTESTGDRYKMVPGATIEKDPKVTVLANSEDCYVFVEIVKSTDKAFDDYMTYAIADGWTELPADSGIYYRAVSASTANRDFAVLASDQVSVKNTVTKAMMDELNEDNYPTLTFTAYAIQKNNLTTTNMTEIWNLAKAG